MARQMSGVFTHPMFFILLSYYPVINPDQTPNSLPLHPILSVTP